MEPWRETLAIVALRPLDLAYSTNDAQSENRVSLPRM